MAPMRPWAVGLDLGTTAVKAVLVSPSGRVEALASRPAPLVERSSGAVEVPLGRIRRAAEAALAEVLADAPRGRLALGIASQRSTVVVWDAQTGHALGPALSWRDRRTPQGWPPLPEREVIRRTGLRLSPHYSAGKIGILLKGRRDASLRSAPLPSWLAWVWSSGRILAADPTLAARMLLWNLETGRWDPVLLEAFGLEKPLLPRLHPTSGSFGTLQAAGRRLSLRAMIGDQQAAAAALGLGSGTGLVNLGTGAFLLAPSGPRPLRAEGLLTTVLWTGACGKRFALEGTVNSAGALFDWMRRRGLGNPSREPLPTPREALGLPACLPALAGTGAPRWDPSAQLRFVPAGASPAAKRKSALLAVAYRLREILDALPERVRPRRWLAAGGLARSSALLQALADLFEAPVIPAEREAAGAHGAALLAQGRLGLPPWSAGAVLPRADRTAGYLRWRRLLR